MNRNNPGASHGLPGRHAPLDVIMTEHDAWMSYPSDDLIARYRRAGVRCRRLDVELFVHVDDLPTVRILDSKEKP